MTLQPVQTKTIRLSANMKHALRMMRNGCIIDRNFTRPYKKNEVVEKVTLKDDLTKKPMSVHTLKGLIARDLVKELHRYVFDETKGTPKEYGAAYCLTDLGKAIKIDNEPKINFKGYKKK